MIGPSLGGCVKNTNALFYCYFLTVSCHSERSEESDNVCFIFSADAYRFFTSFRMTETVGILTHPRVKMLCLCSLLLWGSWRGLLEY